MAERIRSWADLLTVALLTWMGIHTVRTYLAMGGWVLGTGLSTFQLGALLLSIWGIGLLGYPVARLVGGRAPAIRLGLIFGLLYMLYRALPGSYTSPIFGCLSVTAWLWLLPTALRGISLQGAGHQILPGVMLGLAGQISLQTANHGLDMVQLLGPGPSAVALGLAGALVGALRLGSAGRAEPRQPGPDLPGWGLIAWGPYLALQMTLASNLGWVQWFSGLPLQGAAALLHAGLALGALLASRPLPYPMRLGAGLAAVALLAQPAWLTGPGIGLLVAAQALLPLALAPALGPEPGRRVERTYLWLGIGSVITILLILLFYLKTEWKALWPVMAGLAVLPGLLIGARQAGARLTGVVRGAGWLQSTAAIIALGAVAIPLSLIPRSGERPATGPAPADLTVMTYNIHHLFNWRGVPGPEAVARVMEEAGADLIGLQETGRGWNFTGGADLVSWLRWRFPGYHVRYGKTEGDLVGNILLSRWPILEEGWELYEMKVSALQRGLIWARIPTERGDLLFVKTHLSAWRTEEADRINQAEHLLAFWNQEPRFILVGDLNSRPGTEPLRRLEQGGLVDLPGALGMGQSPTFPAGQPRVRLDYVFSAPAVEPVQAEIPETLASDHRPVVVRIRLSD